MIFLMDYDRKSGKLVSFRQFDDTQQAREARLELELELNRQKVEREIVLLEAEDENAIRRTHRRYFDDLPELLRATGQSFN
jgi:hypothetical protein